MTFLYPSFLFALSAIAVPIIIHLFNFRKFKRVYFSNVRFLKEVQQETKNRAKLKQWLILACRILAITAVVLAFAQPVIPPKTGKGNKGAGRKISVYIDNSFSMDAVERGGRLLDIGKNYVSDIAFTLAATDQVQVITNDFEGKHTVFYNTEEFAPVVDEIKSTPVARKMSDVIKRQTDLVKREGGEGKVYLVSDFQKSVTDFAAFPVDSAVDVCLVPVLPAEPENIFIDSCWFESPEYRVNEPMKLKVKIVNLSNTDQENIPLMLSVNGVQKSPISFSVSKGAESIVELNFSVLNTGFQDCKLSILDKQVIFDDSFLFSFYVPDHLNVMVIRGQAGTTYINKIFADDPYFRYTVFSEGQVDYSQLPVQNLVILDEVREISSGLSQELGKFLLQGGSVMIIPSAAADLDSYNEFTASQKINGYGASDTGQVKVDRINLETAFFDDIFEVPPRNNIDLPVIKRSYGIGNSSRNDAETLLSLQNGNKFLSLEQPGHGSIYLWAVPLQESWSNLSKHAIFIPIVLKAALASGNSQPLFYTLGSDQVIKVPNVQTSAEKLVKMKKKDGTEEFIPEQRTINGSLQIRIPGEIKESAVFDLILESDTLARVALNYDRAESDPACYTVEEIAAALQEYNLSNYSLLDTDADNLKKALIEIEEGKSLWKWFIILALIFFALETLFIRVLK